MAEFPTFIPDGFVDRIHDPAAEWLLKNEAHTIVQKLLVHYGRPNTTAMTNAERAATVSSVRLWQLVKDDDVNGAVSVAATDAVTDVTDGFQP